jgi:hypothetical protein
LIGGGRQELFRVSSNWFPLINQNRLLMLIRCVPFTKGIIFAFKMSITQIPALYLNKPKSPIHALKFLGIPNKQKAEKCVIYLGGILHSSLLSRQIFFAVRFYRFSARLQSRSFLLINALNSTVHMTLMAKTNGEDSERDPLNKLEERVPCSIKAMLQASLFFGCLLTIVYFYYGYSSEFKVYNWTDFSG